MKNRTMYIAFIALFLCVGIVLSCGMILFGESKAGANETLSGMPSLFVDGKLNDDFFSQLATYVNDRFFLRQELISANNWLSAKLFSVSGSDSVILGKNDWLYFESTLDDYMGVNALTERDIFAAANNVRLMQEYCESKGIKFAFMITPNKNSLYPENMPDVGAYNPSLNANRMHKYFGEWGVGHVDLFKAFDIEETLYYPTDSHWNIKGAALAADKVNAFFNKNSDYYNQPFYTIKNGYTADLYSMAYPAFKGGTDEIVYGGVWNYTSTTPNLRSDSIIINTQSDNTGSIYVYRDSFGAKLYPFLADAYGSAEFSRNTVYDLSGKDVDFMLIQLVERNIPWLLSFLPVFESGKIDVSLPTTTGNGIIEITESRGSSAPQGHTFWSGNLGVTPDVDSHIYINCDDAVYEALASRENGFGVYLPDGVKPLSVGFKLNGELVNIATVRLSDGTEKPVTPDSGGAFDEVAFNKANGMIDKSVAELYKAIGEPNKKAYLPSCIGSGEDGTLFYNGFSVTTYKEGSLEIVKDVYKE